MATSTKNLVCTVPLAGFANPRYVNIDPTDATGFDIAKFDAISIAFETAATATLVHEQTNDPTGVTGWFAVTGRTINSSQANLTSSGVSNGTGYVYPACGLRARFRITALSAADIVARLAFLTSFRDMSTTAGAGAAHDSAVSGNPIRVAGRAVSANYTAVNTGDTADLITTLVGALIEKPYSIPENDWASVAAATGVTTAVATTIIAAAGAGLKRYITGIQIDNAGATASVVEIKSGAGGTVIWRGKMQAPSKTAVVFPSPLAGAAATLLEYNVVTAGAEIYFNAQGYTAP